MESLFVMLIVFVSLGAASPGIPDDKMIHEVMRFRPNSVNVSDVNTRSKDYNNRLQKVLNASDAQYPKHASCIVYWWVLITDFFFM